MFCQWCGKEREDSSIAIHHCGPKDRPPAYCMSCGATLGEGATACASCGTPAGQEPRATPATAVIVAPVAADTPDATVASVSRETPRPAARARRAASTNAGLALFFRKGMFWSALFGVFACFIDWFPSTPGISYIEQIPWHWWNLPSPKVIFLFMLLCLVLSVIAYPSSGNWIDVLVVLSSAALCVFVGDWIWVLRHSYVAVTGFWLIAAASALIFIFSVASASQRRD